MNDKYVISITPEISKADEAISIKLSGFPKNKKVTVRAVTNNYYCVNASVLKVGDNSIWESYGTFTTDEYGNIDLENQTPIDGTYKICDKMGLFYSMKIKEKHKGKLIQELKEVSENRKYTIIFTAEIDGKVEASNIHTRVYCDDTIQSVDVKENNLLARYFTSKNKRARPAIIVVSGNDGRIEKAQAIAEVFAMHGYSALAVCYFGMDGTPECLTRIPIEYIENAIMWLKKNDTVDSNKISIYGRSKGGELVLLASSLFKDISCVIANTPSCYVYEGINKNNFPSHHSSWTYKGMEIPYIRFNWLIIIRASIKRFLKKKGAFAWLYTKLTANCDTSKNIIDVSKINGPVLTISSTLDEIWPSSLYSETVLEMLKKADFKYEYKRCNYDKSGHLLILPYQAIPSLNGFGGDMESCAKASVDSWNETILFLKKWSCY